MSKLTVRFTIILLLAGVFSANSFAADFEGTIELSIKAKELTTVAQGIIKGPMAKILPKETIQLEGGMEGYPVINFEKKKITLISTKDKYYLDMPLASFESAIAAKPAKIKKTGQTDTLLGYAAEEWTLDDPAGEFTVSVWVTRELSLSVNLMISLQKTIPVEGLLAGRVAKALTDQHLFPLKASIKTKAGIETLYWQILKLNVQPVADTEFAIPAGFGKMSDVLKKNRKPGGR